MIPSVPENNSVLDLAIWLEKVSHNGNFSREDLFKWEQKETKIVLMADIITGRVKKEIRDYFLDGSDLSPKNYGVSNADANAIRDLLRARSMTIPFAWAIWAKKRKRKREISIQALSKAVKEYELEMRKYL